MALASECQQWHIIATDIDPSTLALAQQNAQRLNLTQIQFIQSNWFSQLKSHSVDAIISNPPYIDKTDEHLTALQYEPQQALVAAQQGLADLHHIIKQAKQHLNDDGFLLLEHGYDQGEAVKKLLLQYDYQDIETCYDLAGHTRGHLGYFNHN